MDVTFGVVVSQIFLSNVICSHYRVHHPRREENPYHVLVVSTGSLASRTIVLSCISGLHYNWLGRAGADDSGITFGGWPAAAAAAREAAAAAARRRGCIGWRRLVPPAALCRSPGRSASAPGRKGQHTRKRLATHHCVAGFDPAGNPWVAATGMAATAMTTMSAPPCGGNK
jgi:hypothetical protein